jgi:hypothetical protein
MAGIAMMVCAGSAAGRASTLAQVDGGIYHSCAVLPSASIRCWGFSGDGQLGYGNRNSIGDNETPGSVGPVNIGIGRLATAVAAGDYHTCARLTDGTVRCWGYGFDGQLGYGDRNNIGDDEIPAAVGPVDLGSGRSATTITAGGRHSCALLNGGDVRCWGLGDSGQLGTGTTATIGDTETPGSVDPINFGGGHKATAIAAGGRHTCAILDDNTVRCWGYGGNGQLGYGDTNPVIDPSTVGAVNLGMGRTAKAITAGDSHTCAILDDGTVRCWGFGGDGELGYGNTTQIGDNETPNTVGPVQLGLGRTAKAISAGAAHTCAVLDNGSVRCWGLGLDGRLGYGNTNSIGDNETPASVNPVDVGSGRTAISVGTGQAHTCVLLDDENVRCWGSGDSGRLGYCSTKSIGDDELPGSVGPVNLQTADPSCSPSTGSTPTSTATAQVAPSFAAAVPARPTSVDPLAAQTRRTQSLRICLRAASRAKASKRKRARRACVRRYGRTPGRILGLRVSATTKTTIVLTFTAPGTDGSNPPAAHTYLIKQSTHAIRNARDFTRAHTLCRGSCRFNVTGVGSQINFTVTDLRPRRTYYYALVALDNASRKRGPRSNTVRTRTG